MRRSKDKLEGEIADQEYFEGIYFALLCSAFPVLDELYNTSTAASQVRLGHLPTLDIEISQLGVADFAHDCSP